MAEIKTVTSLATETAITFDDYHQFVWVRNTGEGDCYVSAKSGITAGGADVISVKAGETALVITETNTIYSKGATTLECHAQNFANCPSKSGGKSSGSGGGSAKLDYSLTEQDTGIKWVDGKTIYQRTFELDYDEKSGNNWIICPTTDIDNLMRAEAVDTANRRCLGGIDGVDITSTKIDDVWYFVIDTFFKYVTFWYTKK